MVDILDEGVQTEETKPSQVDNPPVPEITLENMWYALVVINGKLDALLEAIKPTQNTATTKAKEESKRINKQKEVIWK